MDRQVDGRMDRRAVLSCRLVCMAVCVNRLANVNRQVETFRLDLWRMM